MSTIEISRNRIPFLNTFVDNVNADEAKQLVDEYVRSGGVHYVVSPNSDIIVKMQKDPELKFICDNADLILTDGMILVKISQYLETPIKERICMTDFVWKVFELSVEKNYKVFLFGGKSAVLNKAITNIKTRLPQLKIAGSYAPPLGFENDAGELEKAIEQIKNSNADILIVFLGCPKQEKFIFHNKDAYGIPVSITMGGCVDFIAGEVKRAPIWMQNAGLEWFYRFLQEPLRLFRRYFVDDLKIFQMARMYKKSI